MTEPDTAALAPSEPCLRCGRCAGCHAPNGDCPVPNTSCATGTCPQEPGSAAPWPGLEGCVCPRVWKSPGVLYGIRMMACWVRLTDEPDCPIHAPHVIARDGSCVKRGHHHR